MLVNEYQSFSTCLQDPEICHEEALQWKCLLSGILEGMGCCNQCAPLKIIFDEMIPIEGSAPIWKRLTWGGDCWSQVWVGTRIVWKWLVKATYKEKISINPLP